MSHNWSKPYLAGMHIDNIHYNIHPHELSGSYLEYLFQNNLIDVDRDGNMYYRKNVGVNDLYNVLVSSDESDIDTRAVSHELIKVKRLPNAKITIQTDPIFTMNQDLINVSTNESITMTTIGNYITKVFNIAKYKLIKTSDNKYITNPSQFIQLPDRNIFNDLMKKYKSGDIHDLRLVGQMIQYKPLTIFEMVTDNVILIGYPDPHKMSHHLHYINKLKNIHTRHENGNKMLIKHLYEMSGRSDIINPDLVNYFRDLYDETTFNKIAEFLVNKTNEIVDQENLFEQIMTRIKYIFLIGQIDNDGNIIPLFNTIYDINNENHAHILKKTHEIIKMRMYKAVYPESKINQNTINVFSYARYTGFFHIESEYVNAMSNMYTFQYTVLNLITINELITNSTIPDFYNKISVEFNINSKKIIDTSPPTFGRRTRSKDSGSYMDKNLHKNNATTINFKKQKYEVVVFHITNLKEINAILHCNSKYYYMKILPAMTMEKANAIKNTFLDKSFSVEKKIVYSAGQDQYILYYVPNLSLHKIVKFEEIQEFKQYQSIIKYNPLSTLTYMNDDKYKSSDIILSDNIVIDNPIRIINSFVKHLIILSHVKEDRFNNKYSKDLQIDTIRSYDNEKHRIIYYKKKKLMEDSADKFLGWVFPIDLCELIINDYDSKGDSILQTKYFTTSDFIYDISSINETNYMSIIKLIDYYVKQCIGTSTEYDISMNELTDYSHIGLHIKIEKNHKYYFIEDKTQNIAWINRKMYYMKIKEYLSIYSNYFATKMVSLVLPLMPNIIFYKHIEKNMQGGGNKYTNVNLIDFKGFKRLIEIIDVKNDKFEINYIYNKYKDDKNNPLYITLNTLREGLNTDYKNPRLNFIIMFSIIEDLFQNANDILVLGTSSSIKTYYDKYTDKKYDTILTKSSYESPISDNYKNLRDTYGDKNKEIHENFIDVSDKLNNKYDTVLYIQPALNAFISNNFILSSIMFQQTFYNVLIALNALKNGASFGFLFRNGLILPSTQKLIQLLHHLFDFVDTNYLTLNAVMFHCVKFNRDKYLEIKNELFELVKQLPVVTKQEIKDKLATFNNKYGVQSGTKSKIKTVRKSRSRKSSKSNSSNIDVVFDIDIDFANIPKDKYKNDIDILENKYISDLKSLNYKAKIYSEEELTSIIIHEYIQKFMNICDKYKFPYNKYFTSLMKNYHEDIYAKMLSINENIDSTLVLYKEDGSTESFLSKIKSCKPYKYDMFNEVIVKLGQVKNIRKGLIEKYTDKPLKDVVRISEDFTRGISQYLHKRYTIDIVPSNAFTKLWEIYMRYSLVPNKKNVRMFHLAEAPGQFIKATEYFIKKNLKNNETYSWKANSLNPFNKIVTDKYGTALFRDDYQLMKKNRRDWIWGADNTGDITSSDNIRWYRKFLHDWAKEEPIDVVTGDGGLENDTELVNLQKLDYAQFLLCVATCSIGKHCVIKTFTPFLGSKPETLDSSGFYVGLCYLYKLLFREVHLCKPYTSRPTSGEYYVVGKGFLGLSDKTLDKLLDILDNFKENQCFFEKDVIPNSFVLQIHNFINNISNHNIATIERQNFFFTCKVDDSEIGKLNKCKEYLDTKKMESIHNDRYKVWTDLFKFK